MRAKRGAISMIAAVLLATAGATGSAIPASAAVITGGATFTSAGWVQCGDYFVYTNILANVHWELQPVTLHGGVYWALSHVSTFIEINDPSPIRDECTPYLWSRLFSLKNSSGTVVASNQTSTAWWGNPGCLQWYIDYTQWTVSSGCHLENYYFKYTHPAGYIYYGASVFLAYGAGGYAGNTGWKSLGG
jgi:hypothetical protein